eukprot:TRINITY_DN2945_c0_g1_i1.p1 TRINITY_DN2945_c0_g1~~TRINITY_DN2945_c0_g1_i1.p1  ORF type:complete len:124 (+),score=27.77 TRINITY_DN2945_c0_g1_i1:419-790(+)
MRTGDGFLCVYSVTLQASFDEAVNLHEHILRVKDAEEIPFVLVGNKCDLEDAREVTYEKGQSLASDLSCPFLEASAKTRYNVEESFTTLVKEIQKQKQVPTPTIPAGEGTKKVNSRRGGCQLL